MALSALVVCADAKTVQLLARMLQDLGIAVEHCDAIPVAQARLTVERFDAVIVDCVDENPAAELLSRLRTDAETQPPLAIALVDGHNHVREIFAQGANFVLYKPVSQERTAGSLRSARDLMRRERRRKNRIPVHAQASMAYASSDNVPAFLLDLSEEGIAIQSERRLPASCKVYFQFSLPGNVKTIRLSGEI